MNDFAIPDLLSFEADAHGLMRAQIHSPLCRATIYLHGAHLTHWQPRTEAPVLFLSQCSEFAHGHAIRGGVPIIFPWFGAKTSAPSQNAPSQNAPSQNAPSQNAPSHGWARRHEWQIESTRETEGVIEIVMRLDSRDVPEAEEPCVLRFRVRAGTCLEMQLEVENTGDAPLHFEEALHTYFAVEDIHAVSLEGLSGAGFVDKTNASVRKTETQTLRINGETDRVYDSRATITIDDAKRSRRIVVEKSGSGTTVVWNPWSEKAAALPDLGDKEWTQMVCVETANAGANAISLAPRASHRMSAVLRIE